MMVRTFFLFLPNYTKFTLLHKNKWLE